MPISRRTAVLQAIAAAGNAAALLVLVLVLLNARAIFSRQTEGPVPARAASEVANPAQRLLFILIDGLREDAASDASVMPELQRLALKGSRGIAHVEALIPSTIAGVRAEVEGIIVPPAAFVFDFVSPAAPHGGFLESNRRQGGRSFVAAPRVWADLYGAWIDEAVTTTALDGEDQTLLEETVSRLSDPQWRLLVVHFSRPDVAAHLSGGNSPRYRAAAAWCDSAVAQLAKAAGEETIIVITSDHGVTQRGGHAGAESDVVRIPIITTGQGAPRVAQNLRQIEISGLVKSALKAPFNEASAPVLRKQKWLEWTFAAATAAIASFAALRLMAQAAGEQPVKSSAAFWLHTGFWIVGCLGFVQPKLAALTGCLWLAAVAKGSPSCAIRPAAIAVAAGMTMGALRIMMSAPGTASPAKSAHFPTIAQCGLAILLAAALILWVRGQQRRGAFIPVSWVFGYGAFAVLAAELGSHFFEGGTVSLSSIDVRIAFALAQTWAGLTSGAVLAALQPFVPLFCMLLPAAPVLAKMNPGLLSAIAAGAGAVFLGEALFSSAILMTSINSGGLAFASLALALLIRTAASIAFVFPVFAFVSWFALRSIIDRCESAGTANSGKVRSERARRSLHGPL